MACNVMADFKEKSCWNYFCHKALYIHQIRQSFCCWTVLEPKLSFHAHCLVLLWEVVIIVILQSLLLPILRCSVENKLKNNVTQKLFTKQCYIAYLHCMLDFTFGFLFLSILGARFCACLCFCVCYFPL